MRVSEGVGEQVKGDGVARHKKCVTARWIRKQDIKEMRIGELVHRMEREG
jgi:hypothetical protein